MQTSASEFAQRLELLNLENSAENSPADDVKSEQVIKVDLT